MFKLTVFVNGSSSVGMAGSVAPKFVAYSFPVYLIVNVKQAIESSRGGIGPQHMHT